MKVKKEIIAAAIMKLLTNITATMPSSTYKFLMGGLSAAAAVKGIDKINGLIEPITDEDGMIDVDMLYAMLNGAFTSAGGTLQLELFNNGGILGMFVKPLKLNITIADIDPIMQEIRMNAQPEQPPAQPAQHTEQAKS